MAHYAHVSMVSEWLIEWTLDTNLLMVAFHTYSCPTSLPVLVYLYLKPTGHYYIMHDCSDSWSSQPFFIITLTNCQCICLSILNMLLVVYV